MPFSRTFPRPFFLPRDVDFKEPNKCPKNLEDHTVYVAQILACLQETFDQSKRWLNSYLNHEVHLGLRVVLRGLPALAGRVHCVTPPAAPRHGHVTVVREPRDPLATCEDMRTEKLYYI